MLISNLYFTSGEMKQAQSCWNSQWKLVSIDTKGAINFKSLIKAQMMLEKKDSILKTSSRYF